MLIVFRSSLECKGKSWFFEHTFQKSPFKKQLIRQVKKSIAWTIKVFKCLDVYQFDEHEWFNIMKK